MKRAVAIALTAFLFGCGEVRISVEPLGGHAAPVVLTYTGSLAAALSGRTGEIVRRDFLDTCFGVGFVCRHSDTTAVNAVVVNSAVYFREPFVAGGSRPVREAGVIATPFMACIDKTRRPSARVLVETNGKTVRLYEIYERLFELVGCETTAFLGRVEFAAVDGQFTARLTEDGERAPDGATGRADAWIFGIVTRRRTKNADLAFHRTPLDDGPAGIRSHAVALMLGAGGGRTDAPGGRFFDLVRRIDDDDITDVTRIGGQSAIAHAVLYVFPVEKIEPWQDDEITP